MQNHAGVNELITEIDETILLYYDYSFLIESERCMVLIEKLIALIEKLLMQLKREKQIQLQTLLEQVLEAMAKKDDVLVRDLLYYDLRNFFQGDLCS